MPLSAAFKNRNELQQTKECDFLYTVLQLRCSVNAVVCWQAIPQVGTVLSHAPTSLSTRCAQLPGPAATSEQVSHITCCSMTACCCWRRAWSCWGDRTCCCRICCICWGVITWGVIMATDTGTLLRQRERKASLSVSVRSTLLPWRASLLGRVHGLRLLQ